MAVAEIQRAWQGTNSVAGKVTSLSVPWPGATTPGSHLIAIVGVNDNGVKATPIPPSPFWKLIAAIDTDGNVVRENPVGTPQIEQWWYEVPNAPSQSGTVIWQMDRAVHFDVDMFEFSGAVLVALGAGLGQASTGALQTNLTTGTLAANGSTDQVYLAKFVVANTGALSFASSSPSGFTLGTVRSTGGTASSDKLSTVVATKYVGTNVSGQVSINAAGGFNRNYVGAILAIIGAAAVGGSPSGWDDGKHKQACSLDYYQSSWKIAATVVNGITIRTALQNAQLLADRCMIVRGWAQAPSEGSFDNYNGFADDMRSRNAGIMMMPYTKSVVETTFDDLSGFPENWHAHTANPPSPSNRSPGETTNLSLGTMQPDHATAAYTDPRGFTATTWAIWKGHDANQHVDDYNTFKGTPGALDCAFLDSMGPSSFGNANAVDWASGTPGTKYTKPQWTSLIRTIPDKVKLVAPTRLVFCNGLVSRSEYWKPSTLTDGPSSGLLDHCDGAEAEAWLRTNYQNYGSWPSLSSWKDAVNMLIDAQLNRNKYIIVTTNIANKTANPNPPGGFVAYTTPQEEQWLRFALCTFELGQRGKATHQWVRNAPTLKPYDDDHPYFNANLGTPTIFDGSLASMALPNGLYHRTYAAGLVLVNPTGAALTYTLPDDYVNPDGGQIFSSGEIVIIPSFDGMKLVLTSGVTNTDVPVIVKNAPPDTFNDSLTKTLDLTITDADGINGTFHIFQDGVDRGAPTNAGGGRYTKSLTFTPDVPSIVTGTVFDNHGSPLSTAFSYTLTFQTPPPPPPPPVVGTGDDLNTIDSSRASWYGGLYLDMAPIDD